MSDELYVENFSKKDKASQVISEAQSLSIAQDKPTENYNLAYQMITYLDRLERVVQEDYQGFANLDALFTKLRNKIRNGCAEEIIGLLNDLEELLDLRL